MPKNPYMDLSQSHPSAQPLEAAPASGGSGHECWIIGSNERRAFEALKVATRGSFNFWDLAGAGNSKARQVIASALDGKKVPVAKCGVTALRDAFYRILRLNTPSEVWAAADCLAARESLFAEYAAGVCVKEAR